MADLTDSVVLEKVPYSNWAKIGEDKCYDIDLSVITDGLAIGTHNVLGIPVGSALMDAAIVIKESAASAADGASVQFKIGNETLTAAIPQADLVAGKVIKLVGNVFTGVVTETETADAGADVNVVASIDVDGGVSAYCPVTADTLDMVVSGEALTALRYVIVAKVWDVDKALGNA